MLWHDRNRNSRRDAKAATGRFALLLSIARDNPFTALWNAILFTGGAILLLYHVKVGYLPDFAVADLAGLLASVTLIGIAMLVFLTASFLLPSFTLAQFDKEWAKGHQGKTFHGQHERLLLLGLPVATWGLTFALPPLVAPWFPDEIATFSITLLTLLLALPVLGMLFLALRDRRGAPVSGKYLTMYFWSNMVKLGALVLWTFLFFLPAAFAVTYASIADPDYEWFFFGMSLLLFIIVNGVAYVSGKDRWVESLGVGTLLVAIVLPLLLSRPLLWLDVVVGSVGLGNRNAAEIVMSYRQCQSFAKFGINCDYKEHKDSEIALNNVNVLSRVGTSVLLELLVDTQAVKPGEAGAAPGELRTAQRGRYCAAASTDNPAAHCSTCDDVTLRAAVRQGHAKLVDRYKGRLACVQIVISKDQITSMSLSSTRRYAGFTSIIASGGHHP